VLFSRHPQPWSRSVSLPPGRGTRVRCATSVKTRLTGRLARPRPRRHGHNRHADLHQHHGPVRALSRPQIRSHPASAIITPCKPYSQCRIGPIAFTIRIRRASPPQALLRLRKRFEHGEDDLLLAADTQVEVATWERGHAESQIEWKRSSPETFVSAGGATLTRQTDGSLLAGGSRPERDTYTITRNRTSYDSHRGAPRSVDRPFVTQERTGPTRQRQSAPQRVSSPPVRTGGADAVARAALGESTADFNQSGWTIEHALDRNEKTAWESIRRGRAAPCGVSVASPARGPGWRDTGLRPKQLHGEDI